MDFLYGKRPVWQASDVEKVVLRTFIDCTSPRWCAAGLGTWRCNWVKVVQRLPVRIEILEYADRPILRAGMTATITVDTEQDKSFETVWGQYMETLDGWKQQILAFNDPAQGQ